jgi:hypothetical protein
MGVGEKHNKAHPRTRAQTTILSCVFVLQDMELEDMQLSESEQTDLLHYIKNSHPWQLCLLTLDLNKERATQRKSLLDVTQTHVQNYEAEEKVCPFRTMLFAFYCVCSRDMCIHIYNRLPYMCTCVPNMYTCVPNMSVYVYIF